MNIKIAPTYANNPGAGYTVTEQLTPTNGQIMGHLHPCGFRLEPVNRFVEHYNALVKVAEVPPVSPVYDIVFVGGGSITYGATLANPSTEAAPVQCQLSLGQHYNAAVNIANQGQSGTTTVDWLPSSNPSSLFQLALAAAAALETNQPGLQTHCPVVRH